MCLLRASISNVSTSNFYLLMKPLINLKLFLAVLLILIVPAALLVAYFRNYSSDAPAHDHSEKGKSDRSEHIANPAAKPAHEHKP